MIITVTRMELITLLIDMASSDMYLFRFISLLAKMLLTKFSTSSSFTSSAAVVLLISGIDSFISSAISTDKSEEDFIFRPPVLCLSSLRLMSSGIFELRVRP